MTPRHWIPSKGSFIKVLGEQTADLEFQARAVLPWNFDPLLPFGRPRIPPPIAP